MCLCVGGLQVRKCVGGGGDVGVCVPQFKSAHPYTCSCLFLSAHGAMSRRIDLSLWTR